MSGNTTSTTKCRKLKPQWQERMLFITFKQLQQVQPLLEVCPAKIVVHQGVTTICTSGITGTVT
eukprot:m.113133 g.113133  ORF g.113133 m.113133 type:complete len:64 (-) comp17064_c0_seq1:1424-1615(-)